MAGRILTCMVEMSFKGRKFEAVIPNADGATFRWISPQLETPL